MPVASTNALIAVAQADALERLAQERELRVVIRSRRRLLTADDIRERRNEHAQIVGDLERDGIAPKVVEATRSCGLKVDGELTCVREQRPHLRAGERVAVDLERNPVGIRRRGDEPPFAEAAARVVADDIAARLHGDTL